MPLESRKKSAFTRVKSFSPDCYSDVMIAVTVAATVTCPPAFLGYCRNSESGTVHVSGWC